MKYLTAPLAALLVAGCSMPEAADRADLSPALDAAFDDDLYIDHQERILGDGDVDPERPDEPVEPDDDDDDDPVEPPAWDATPPDAPDGSQLWGTVNCGLLDGPHDLGFEKQGEQWVEIPSEAVGLGPYPELAPCMGRAGEDRGDKWLLWDDAPSMYMNAAALHHDLVPTTVENRWVGEVHPMNPPSTECLDALEDWGMSFPVTMTFEVYQLDIAD